MVLDPASFRAVEVSEAHKADFYRLMRVQETQHGVAEISPEVQRFEAERLYHTAIEQRGIGAFLVVDGQHTLGAVTYNDCLGPEGRGLYLEDIVTDPEARGHGVGRFAMRYLAEISCGRDARFLQWECAAHNTVAQEFYSGLDASFEPHLQTWRFLGALPQAGMEGIVCRPMQAADVAEAARQLAWCDVGSASRLEAWLGQAIAQGTQEDAVYLSAHEVTTGRLTGALFAHRGFSTFRVVSGLHIDGLAACGDRPRVTQALLAAAAEVQQGARQDVLQTRAWEGHCDITLPVAQASVRETLAARGFEPLTYGHSPMTVRRLSRQQLEALAHPMTEPRLSGSAAREATRSAQSPLRVVHLAVPAAA